MINIICVDQSFISFLLSNRTALHNAKKRINRFEEQTVAMTSSGIGDLNALVFHGVMEFEDALQYLKIRTDAMSLLAANSNTRSLLIWEKAATNPKFMCKAAKEWCLRKGESELKIPNLCVYKLNNLYLI